LVLAEDADELVLLDSSANDWRSPITERRLAAAPNVPFCVGR
jgi:hypothetical protein